MESGKNRKTDFWQKLSILKRITSNLDTYVRLLLKQLSKEMRKSIYRVHVSAERNFSKCY